MAGIRKVGVTKGIAGSEVVEPLFRKTMYTNNYKPREGGRYSSVSSYHKSDLSQQLVWGYEYRGSDTKVPQV